MAAASRISPATSCGALRNEANRLSGTGTGNTDRKEFLKAAGGRGVCGCALSFLGLPKPADAEETAAPDQRLAFARHQVARLVGFMATDLAPAGMVGVIEKTGCECATLGQLQVKLKGDPDGYFAAIKQAWGTEASWDKEKGIITVAVPDGECGCPMVDTTRAPALRCNCSVGYQKNAFETISGRPVKASLKESKLSGSKRCVFEVRLA